MPHIKSSSLNVQIGEASETYFTPAEWDAHLVAEQAEADVEAARDLKQELLDRLDPAVTAFMKVYAKRENVTMKQIRDAIKAEL